MASSNFDVLIKKTRVFGQFPCENIYLLFELLPFTMIYFMTLLFLSISIHLKETLNICFFVAPKNQALNKPTVNLLNNLKYGNH